MNVTETKTEGLERRFHVSIPASEVDARIGTELNRIKGQVHLKGFRPGKAPISHLKKLYGKAIVQDVVESMARETSVKTLEERDLRAAAQPHVNVTSDTDKIVTGGEDLNFDIEVEIMPDFSPIEPSELTLAKKVAEPEDADIDKALEDLAESQRPFEEKDGPAVEGDKVVIDFVGKIDGEAFEGGTAEAAEIILGRGGFIPGFEKGLTGVSAGDEKTIEATFPEDYPMATLAGKTAHFDVTVREVRAPGELTIDDDLAKNYGREDLEDLKTAVRERLEQELNAQSRAHLKRALLDALDEKHAFDLPPKMVEAEFSQIWAQVEQAKEAGQLGPEDEGKSDDELKDEYRAIAERRVRLGLVLAEIGRINKIQVSDNEMSQALAAEARRYPGQEQQVYDYFRQNPGAMAQVRAPIFEEKVVDFILELATVETTTVSKDELAEDPDGRLGEDGAAAAAS